MDFLKKIGMILTAPSKFFDKVKSEKSVNSAFSFLLLASIVSLIATIVLAINGPMESLGITEVVVVSLFAWTISILLTFVIAAIVSFSAIRLGGKGNYVSGYKAVVYGSLPSYLLGWMPFAGFVFSLWSLFIQAKGISRMYKISMPRSVIAVIIPSIITMLLAGLTFLYLLWVKVY
jgi:hypothetical protein